MNFYFTCFFFAISPQQRMASIGICYPNTHFTAVFEGRRSSFCFDITVTRTEIGDFFLFFGLLITCIWHTNSCIEKNLRNYSSHPALHHRFHITFIYCSKHNCLSQSSLVKAEESFHKTFLSPQMILQSCPYVISLYGHASALTIHV